VAVFHEGVPGWAKAGYPLVSIEQYPDIAVPIISADELAHANRSSSVLVDIRPPNHFYRGHIEGSINIDLEDLYDEFNVLPKDRKIVLIDHKGKLTLTTARFLTSRGFADVARLGGGFNAWAKSGLPVEK
jgi:rhodanese-related sulfurtransferase